MSSNFTQTAAFIWSVADLLRGDFKQSQYGRVILPFTLLRRLECVLQASKAAVLAEVQRIAPMNLPQDAQEKLLLRAAGLSFFNTSAMDLSKLGEKDIKDNLASYIQCFSRDAREIFEYFKFGEFIAQLSDANLLYKVVQKFAGTDLSPAAISNHEMGLVFEELIRRFAESSNETAGEHFTPRDIVRLTTSLVFMEDDAALTRPGIIRTIYDPTAGTAFGYRRITIERALRTSVQLSDQRLAELRFAPKPFNAAMRWIYDEFGAAWTADSYGQISADQALLIRARLKADFAELKEAQIKDLLAPALWRFQWQLLQKARALQAILGSAQADNFNLFELALKQAQAQAQADADIKLDAREKKQLLDAISWTNAAAERVIAKVHKAGTKARAQYGLFACDAAEVARNTPKTGKPLLKLGDVLEYQTDGSLRENENVPLDPTQSVTASIEAYFHKEVAPHVPDAWIDESKRDKKDGEIGIVGYEINFNRYFYQYQPPRQLAEIDFDLKAVEAEIAALLGEVTA